MVKLQELRNKKANKVSYTLNVPHEIVKFLGLKKGAEFVVSFDKEKGEVRYIKIK